MGLLLFFPMFLMAQTRVISGTVSDDMGPIMMANVHGGEEPEEQTGNHLCRLQEI